MQITRVFRNKAQTFCVSVQASFGRDRKKAREFAECLDRIKATSAYEGTTFSDALFCAIRGYARRKPKGQQTAVPLSKVITKASNR